MIITSDRVTCKNNWQITPLVTNKVIIHRKPYIILSAYEDKELLSTCDLGIFTPVAPNPVKACQYCLVWLMEEVWGL